MSVETKQTVVNIYVAFSVEVCPGLRCILDVHSSASKKDGRIQQQLLLLLLLNIPTNVNK